MKDVEKVILQLTTNEKTVLKNLEEGDTDETLQEKTGLEQVEISRALQWLENKDVITIEKDVSETIVLGKNGKRYVENDLPEKTFLKEIEEGSKTRTELLDVLDEDEIEVCIGLLKQQGCIEIEKNKGLTFSITDGGENVLKDGFRLEPFLSDLPKDKEDVDDTILKRALQRKDLVEKKQKKMLKPSLTSIGEKIKDSDKLDTKIHDSLSREDLASRTFEDKTYRHYDVTSDVPRPEKGRKHFVNEAIEYIQDIYISLGFEEMDGDHVQSSFWNLDALFVPQDHPAREMQDTFYLDVESDLPEDYVDQVKDMHLGNKGGKGWSDEYDESIAKQTLLRTHTTVLSAKKFSQISKEDLPKKYFVVGKNYRNEALDWKHLFEFHQVDGIVIDEEGSLAKLKGHLQDFFGKMGYPDARIRPAYFPYTEPSCEVDVYHPEKEEWIEIGGAGIIRPEITEALIGEEIPVMAWGLGLERIISNYFNITDIRKIYENDIQDTMNKQVFIR